MERLDRQEINLWFNGERVTGPLSRHPAFQGLIRTQAELYDMQCDGRYKDRMTYLSPDTGEPVGLSFLPPKEPDDLRLRRAMMELWSSRHHGFLGRSPDYMNTAIMSLFTAADILEAHDPQYAENLRNYYAYCRDRDITLSHAFVQPYASRMSGHTDAPEDAITAKAIDVGADGMVVSGAFLMTTQGATCEEILVFPSPPQLFFQKENPFAFAFAVPNDLPGITFICRESYASISAYDHPLSSKYEEMDTLVIFDRVMVPKDRIFYYGDDRYHNRLFKEGQFHAQVAHQVVTRYIAKTEFLLGTLESLADEQNSRLEPSTVMKIGKILSYLETFKALRAAAEHEASRNRFGYFVPASGPLLASVSLFPDFYADMVDMIRQIGSSGLIMIPTEKDFHSQPGDYLRQYLRGETTEAPDRTALFRLAWELGLNAFGGRQIQFERLFFGNAQTMAYRMYNGYGHHERLQQLIRDFISNG